MHGGLFLHLFNYYSCSGQSLGTSLAFENSKPVHDNLLLKKSSDMITQVLEYFFSASDIMAAIRGHFRFYGMKVVSYLIIFKPSLL